MKVLVVGSVGYGGLGEIRELQKVLESNGFEVLNQFKLDYSYVNDFRGEEDVSESIIQHDLKICDEADVIILLASRPSFGAMSETIISALKGKHIVVFAPKPLKSPWPLKFANFVAKSVEELIKYLRNLDLGVFRVIPNIYGNHESIFEYRNFRCICPVTGTEDRAKIRIRYEPGNFLLEYESLDNYFIKFSSKKLHHEGVVSRIFNDISKLVKPKNLEVEAEFEERSGVKATVRMSTFGKPFSREIFSNVG